MDFWRMDSSLTFYYENLFNHMYAHIPSSLSYTK